MKITRKAKRDYQPIYLTGTKKTLRSHGRWLMKLLTDT